MRRVERRDRGVGRRLGDQRGSVMAAFAVSLPIFLLVASLVTDVGLRVWVRAVAQASADLAALAAVQEIDLDRLSRGERWILEGAAMSRARAVAFENLNRSAWVLQPEVNAIVDVRVFNPEEGRAVVHPRDGRRLRDPTVCVTVEIDARAAALTVMGRRIRVSAHADASVVEKK